MTCHYCARRAAFTVQGRGSWFSCSLHIARTIRALGTRVTVTVVTDAG